MSTYRFLSPRALAALRDLELIARTVVDGLLYGAHSSRMPGAGLEFSQYRSYQAGDDLRRLDWKLLGRSDRYFVREAETETSVTVRLLLDASESMTYADGGVSRFDYARYLAAALATLAHRQGDAVGLAAVSDGGVEVVPPARGPRHYHRLLHALESLEARGAWPPWKQVEALLAGSGPRGITLILTDLHERGDEIRLAAQTLAALRHDVAVLHLLGQVEETLDVNGVVTVEEIETGRRVELDADAARPAYLDARARELATLRSTLDDRRIGYAAFRLDEPLELGLRRFLTRRAE